MPRLIQGSSGGQARNGLYGDAGGGEFLFV